MLSTNPPTGEEIYSYRKENPGTTWRQLSEKLEVSVGSLRYRELKYRENFGLPPIGLEEGLKTDKSQPKPKGERLSFTDKGFKAELYSISKRIKSLEQLLAASSADLSKWQVSRYTINVWEGGRKKKIVDLTWTNGVMEGYVEDTGDWQLTDFWQVKATLEPRRVEPWEKALDGLIKKIQAHAPLYSSAQFKYKPVVDGYAMVVNLYDAHLGKRPHRSIKYSLENARDDFIRIAQALAAQAARSSKEIEKIIVPVGHDLLHVDGLDDKTSKGTWVETSEDVRDIIDAACMATAKSIESFATVAPVVVIPVEGNHDRMQTYWLTKYLQAFFTNHPNVEVMDCALERQYYQWGKVGLGFTHDGKNPQQLTTLFPIEARYMWPDIEWTEWLTGHMHHQRGALYAVDSVRGTVVRTIPALCDMDNYHSLHLYVGAHRAAEALFYHKENGPAGGFPVFVSEL